jgi:hypothetical protein
MGRAIGIVLDALHNVLSRLITLEVHRPDSAPHTATSVSHRDTSSVVATTLSVADFGESEFGVWLSLPEMVVDGALQVTYTGCPGFVRLHLERTGDFARRRRGCGSGCGIFGGDGGLQRLFLSRGVSAGHRREETAVGIADGSYPGLQHGCGVCEDQSDLWESGRLDGHDGDALQCHFNAGR